MKKFKCLFSSFFSSLCLLLLSVVGFSAYAQDGDVFIPSDEALNTTAIPIRDRTALAARLYGVTDVPPLPINPPSLNVGDQKIFYVSNTSTNDVLQVPATLRTVGDHIYLWVEDSTARVDDDRLQVLTDAFDDFVYDSVREIWGSEDIPGIDGDARVHGLISYEVGSSVAAYFMNDNTLPSEVVSHSNEHEMFLISGSVFASYDLEYLESIIAHEFQHMIRANVQMNEETWMNEGFSEFTQFHLYPNSTYGEIYSYLFNPNIQLNSWSEDYALRSANYGAAGLFITYFYDRYGLDALQLLSHDNAPRGLQSIDNVLASLGEPDVNHFFADWVLANYLFNPNVGASIYGYATIPIEMATLRPELVSQFPSSIDGEVSQYAADYYQLRDWGDAQTLTISLDAPQTVNIIPARSMNGDRFAYSNRADMSDTRMTRAFDLTDVEQATLEYRVWHHFEELWDYGYVMVSADGGETWDILASEHTRDENPYLNAYGAGYTGKSGTQSANTAEWVKEFISLDAYAGQEILVRFEVITDDAINQPGMAIDDVMIPEIGYVSDFETINDWVLEGWIWTDNRLDQRAWVQVIQELSDDVVISRFEYDGQAANGTWTLDLAENVERITVVVSAFAPVTTVPMPYELNISGD